MASWKAPLSLRVRQGFRREPEEAASTERRTLGNLVNSCSNGLTHSGKSLGVSNGS